LSVEKSSRPKKKRMKTEKAFTLARLLTVTAGVTYDF
jgi:hypothetical protein